MTNGHEYATETRAALAALSRRTCYFPGCRTPILVSVDGRPEINVETAPIDRTRPHQRFDDLLLLCVPHRRTVDRDRAGHPADLLQTWKDAREAGGRAALRDLPADRVDDLLVGAPAAVRDQIGAALARFAQADPEAAELVRLLVDGLDGHRARDADLLGEVARLVEQVRARRPEPERRNVGWTARPAAGR